MRSWSSEGLVLRTYDLGETDRIVLLLTPNDGLVRCIAKGVRRPGSRFGGALEQHAMVRVHLNQGATFQYINQAELLRPHRAIATSWVTASCAATMAEAMSLVALEGHRDFPLFNGHLQVLAQFNAYPTYPVNILDAALLRLASMQGVAPVVGRCAFGDNEPVAGFSVEHGGMVCANHLPGAFARLDEEEYTTFQLLALADWPFLASTFLPERPGRLIYRWVNVHLHITLKAWQTVHRSTTQGR